MGEQYLLLLIWAIGKFSAKNTSSGMNLKYVDQLSITRFEIWTLVWIFSTNLIAASPAKYG